MTINRLRAWKAQILIAGLFGLTTVLCEAGALPNSHRTPIAGSTAAGDSLSGLSYGPLVSGPKGVAYNTGAVTPDHVNLYVVWYGTWSVASSTALLPNFLSTLSTASKNLNIARATTDSYSRGATLTDDQIPAVVTTAINEGRLPADAHGIYFVVTSPEVTSSAAASIGTPANIEANVASCNGLYDVDWTAVAGATQYHVWVRAPFTQSYTLRKTVAGTSTLISAGSSGPVTGVEIQACDATSCGDISAPIFLGPYSGCP